MDFNALMNDLRRLEEVNRELDALRRHDSAHIDTLVNEIFPQSYLQDIIAQTQAALAKTTRKD